MRTEQLLIELGFQNRGPDPDQREYTLWSQDFSGGITISVPSKLRCGQIANTIFHAGETSARQKIAQAREAYLAAFT